MFSGLKDNKRKIKSMHIIFGLGKKKSLARESYMDGNGDG